MSSTIHSTVQLQPRLLCLCHCCLLYLYLPHQRQTMSRRRASKQKADTTIYSQTTSPTSNPLGSIFVVPEATDQSPSIVFSASSRQKSLTFCFCFCWDSGTSVPGLTTVFGIDLPILHPLILTSDPLITFSRRGSSSWPFAL